jgi:hypothetical protein
LILYFLSAAGRTFQAGSSSETLKLFRLSDDSCRVGCGLCGGADPDPDPAPEPEPELGPVANADAEVEAVCGWDESTSVAAEERASTRVAAEARESCSARSGELCGESTPAWVALVGDLLLLL